MSFIHYLIFYCVTLIDTSSLTGIDLSLSINNSISIDKVDQLTNATTEALASTASRVTTTIATTTTLTFESTLPTLATPEKNESLVPIEIIQSNSTFNMSEVETQNSTHAWVEQPSATLTPLEYSTSSKSSIILNNDTTPSESTTLETTLNTSSSLLQENSSLSKVAHETLAVTSRVDNETKNGQDERVKSELQVQTEGEEEEDGESDVYLVSNRRQCQPSQSHSIEWETVDASVMASKPCPLPYTGTAYRACYSMGHWEEPDLTECRLPHLREIQNLIFYHVHKHLVDGLYPLAEELNRLLQSPSLPIHSPMDKLDALDSLNSILKTKLRIKLDDEDRDVLFIKSLISSSEQLLTQLPLAFPLETEKNALLTMKSVETIFGLKSLSESLLRALIVFCNDGTIRQIKSFNPITTNIALTLTHVTPFGDHISLLHSEDDSHEIEHTTTSPTKPKANIFLEDFRRYGMGISEIYLKNVDKDFDSDSMSLVSDIIVISVVPPISIEASFERVPQIEIDFALHQTAAYQEKLICGKLRSPRELWSHKECQIVFRNLTFIRCSCSELGIFGVVQVKSLTSQQHSFNHHNQCHFNSLIIYLSSGLSLIFILVTMAGQVVIMVKSPLNRKSCYILLNLLTCLALIEIIFLFGGPFQSSSTSSSFPPPLVTSLPSISKPFSSAFIVDAINFVTPCKMISMVLHYLHLVVSFTMLTYSIYLYNKLWHYQDIITPDNNNNEVICYPDNGSLLPITVTNNGQSFSSSESLPATRQNYYQQYHHQHHQQQQQSIQQTQSFSSYSSFPYFFSSPSTSPTQSSSSSTSSNCSSSSSSSTSPTSCEKALISWNQPNLHKEPDSQRIINLLLFTWIASLLCVITANIINPLGYETKRYCWMSIEGGMMFSFIVPVSLLIMSNTVTMLLILKRFFAYKPITHKIEIERVEPSLRSGVSLLPFFAVNWFLSVLALEDTATNIFQYLFSFCNLIQHLLIFLFHCYQRPEIHQIFAIYFYNGNYNRTDKSNLKSKKNYWCSANCATVPLLIYSDDGSNRLPDNCFEDPATDMGRLKDQ